MPQVRLEKPPNPYNRSEPLRVRVSDSEMEMIGKKADRFCAGNISEWIRLAAVKFEGSKSAKLDDDYTRPNPLLSRASKAESDLIQTKADKFCGGNVSEWLRLAALKYEPLTGSKKVEIISDSKKGRGKNHG